MKSLNIGILAHVDAGKTSLTERLLFESGVIQTLGSVDIGDTQTDSLALERKRGITIQSAVVSFNIGNLKVNLIDTPGHPDFIAEVERALGVLDAVILVVSAVEGVQSQTRVLARTLKKLYIPTFIFINKVDRMGAQGVELVATIQAKLFPKVITMNTVENIGNRDAKIIAIAGRHKDDEKLTAQIGRTECYPAFFGSALTGVGVSELMRAVETYFPPRDSSSDTLLSAVIFKIERGQHDEKIAYVRVYAGELRTRSQVKIHHIDAGGADMLSTEKITAMHIFKDGSTVEVQTANAGDIVKVVGLHEARINDWIGRQAKKTTAYFKRPSLEVVVTSKNPVDRTKLHSALTRMGEQDPLIRIHQNEQGVLSVRLYGEVQREIIQALLHNEYGIDVLFEETKTISIEKPCGTGTSFADRHDPNNSFEATIGFRIEPGIPDSGVLFKIGVGRGSLPVAFQRAIEETVYKTLEQGIFGWEVTDCVVEVTHAGYDSVLSTGGDFRKLTPLLLMEALQKAGTDVYEPLNHFELEVPHVVLAQALQSLVKAEAKLDRASVAEHEFSQITGTIPVRRTLDFERNIPSLTQGEGVFVVEFGGYQKMCGTFPTRERTDANPLNQQEYLRNVLKRG